MSDTLLSQVFTASFTDEEIENYKEAFLEYDVDESGSINIQGESAGDIYLQ